MMLRAEDLYRIVCRPALPKDTADAMELTSLIWEGDDYVPGAWVDWLDDHQGMLAVAEYGGGVVALGKLTAIDQNNWWLEGLRVHPDYEGWGVASHLHDYLIDYWTKHGHGLVRLATSSKREAVHHLCKRSGFRKVGEVASYKAAAVPGVEAHFRLINNDEVDQALDFIQGSTLHHLACGLIDVGWQWVVPSQELLSKVVGEGRAWWWGRGSTRNGLLVARHTERNEESRLRIETLICDLSDLRDCLEDIRSFATEWGVDQVRWMAPIDPSLTPILESSAYQRDRDHTIFIFEKVHTGFGDKPAMV
jgi:GNAT superfamily N-acetyltransferase